MTAQARLITDIADLEACVGAWDALWRRIPTATPFQSPAWLTAWQRVFAPGELCCAVAFEQERMVALAPFYLECGPLGRRLLPVGVSLSDYLDVLEDPLHPGAAAAAVARLAQTEWDEWRLEALAPEALALAASAPAGARDVVIEQDACPVVALNEGGLAGSVPARQRRKLRRARAAAERMGDLVIRSDLPAQVFLEELFALHRRRWQQRGEAGVLADPRVQAFHRIALPALVEAGLARTLVMTIAGRRVGAYYGLSFGGRAYAYLGGFDPEFEEASPGALTIEAAMQNAIDEGVREFHFLRGREAYKYAWGARDRINRARVWTHG